MSQQVKELAAAAILGWFGYISNNIENMNEYVKLISGTLGSMSALILIVKNLKTKKDE